MPLRHCRQQTKVQYVTHTTLHLMGHIFTIEYLFFSAPRASIDLKDFFAVYCQITLDDATCAASKAHFYCRRCGFIKEPRHDDAVPTDAAFLYMFSRLYLFICRYNVRPG